MIGVYKAVTFLLYLLFTPFFWIWFGRKERLERKGIIKNNLENCIWIHAASLGEVNAVRPLINRLLNLYPHHNFCLSTVTRTGRSVAENISPKLSSFYLPMDVSFLQKRLIRKINPVLVLLVETEFWPNMLSELKKNKIPIVMINARISDKSYPRYRNSRFFWNKLWQAIAAVNAQSEKDAQRFESLHFRNVQNTHNLKFSLELPELNKKHLRKELGYLEDDYIIVWGSSRPGEEKLLLSIYPELKRNISHLKLVIVPRHLHRISELKNLLKPQNMTLYSNLGKVNDILLVDEMGILTTFYALADLAVIGGSFYNFGGHNPLEAAFYAVPIIIGNFYSSCRDSVHRLEENHGIVISNRKELQKDILQLHQNPEKALRMGQNAKRTLQLHADSLQENLQIIRKYIS